MTIRGKFISLQLLIIIILSIGLYLTFAYVRSLRAKVGERDAQIAIVEAEKDGFKALLETPKTQDIVPHLPPPQGAKKAFKAPEIAASIIGETVVIEVPIDCPPQPPSLLAPSEPFKPTVNFDISASAELRLDLIGTKLASKGTIFTTLANRPLGWERITEHPIAENSAVAISPNLQKIINRGVDHPSRFAIIPRPIRHTRVGWSIGVDPICSLDDQRVCVAATYGLQF